MREIKFRGQTGTTEGKKWVYGNYYKVKSFFNDKEGHFIGMIRNNHLNDFNVDENTLGQFTGLKDKNGKEIYEGDIVKVNDEIIAKVIWDKDYLGYFLYTNEENSIDSFENGEQPLYDYFGSIEVIGNVFENPELVKEE